MLEAFLVIAVLCIIDQILLVIMPGFYFKIGIPIYKQSAALSQKASIKDLGKYFGFSEKLVYKVKDDMILFRTKFNYFTLYRIGFLSIVKGEAKINNGEIKIIQRLNLTTLYFAFLILFIIFTQKIDVFGKVAIIIIAIIGFLFHLVKNAEIEKIRIDIRDNLSKDFSTHHSEKY